MTDTNRFFELFCSERCLIFLNNW